MGAEFIDCMIFIIFYKMIVKMYNKESDKKRIIKEYSINKCAKRY